MEEIKTTEPIKDVNSSVWKYICTHYILYLIIYLFLAAAAIYFIPTPFTVVAVFAVGFFGYSKIYKKIKSEFTQEFGKSIGFVYEPTAGLETVSGKLFKTGHSQYLYDVLSGLYQDIPMRILSYRFTIGYGKGSHTFSYTVFEATLEGCVSDIMLCSKSHASAISDLFAGDETIELEGDFNKYFKLRVPKGHEQEAYQILTPDVMADLIDKAGEVSFEFVGNKLYVYATKIIVKRDELQSMFDLSEYLIGLFKKNTASIGVVSTATVV